MAAKTQLGDAEKLTRYTISMSHPDAVIALQNGNVSAHFAAPPFQYRELQDPKVRTILTSKEVMNGPFSFTVAWTTVKFKRNNPQLYEIFIAALEQAMAMINADKRKAAEIYLRITNGAETIDQLSQILSDPDVAFTQTPSGTKRYAGYMLELGLIKKAPKTWQDLVFENLETLSGS